MRRVASVAGEHKVANGTLLTRREREILRLIGDGLSNKEIASTLRIELATVKNHVHNILEKLRVGSRRGGRGRARARRARPDLDLRARDPDLRLNQVGPRDPFTRRAAARETRRQCPRGGNRWSAPGSCS
jgi:DNA-binding CsgD family transcriptional regulator